MTNQFWGAHAIKSWNDR